MANDTNPLKRCSFISHLAFYPIRRPTSGAGRIILKADHLGLSWSRKPKTSKVFGIHTP